MIHYASTFLRLVHSRLRLAAFVAAALLSSTAARAVPFTQLHVLPGNPHYVGDNLTLFVSISSYSYYAGLTSLTFDFGDGSTLQTITNSNSTSHSFATPGTFLVSYTGSATESYQSWEYLYSYWVSRPFGGGYYNDVYGWVWHTNTYSISGGAYVDILPPPANTAGVPDTASSMGMFGGAFAALLVLRRRTLALS